VKWAELLVEDAETQSIFVSVPGVLKNVMTLFTARNFQKNFKRSPLRRYKRELAGIIPSFRELHHSSL
jgi:hypothetical protein